MGPAVGTVGGSIVGSRPASRLGLARRLRQNWLAKHPVEPVVPHTGLDDSLTSLSWLQNLNIMKLGGPTPPASPVPADPIVAGISLMTNGGCSGLDNSGSFTSNVNPNAILNVTNLPRIKQEPGIYHQGIGGVVPGSTTSEPFTTAVDKVDYRHNGHMKPPYSYATLICMAMKESQKNKITLAGIYTWITENFMYYRMADPSWQNSIRHNLSLNKCFQKVARRKDEPGKGGFWRINPDFEDMFVNGIFKKRRCSAPLPTLSLHSTEYPSAKRIKTERLTEEENAVASLGNVMWVGEGAYKTLASQAEELKVESAAGSVLRLQPAGAPAGGVVAVNAGELSDGFDFSWNAILSQDIEIGGVRVKTEDIIDDRASAIASPITALSPPPSDSNSNISLEDLLNSDPGSRAEMDSPLDLSTGDALDLTVQGVGLRAPGWWDESFNGKDGLMSSFLRSSGHGGHNRSGMSTPVGPADNDPDLAHPWAEDRCDSEIALASFDRDFGNLFDLIESIPSPKSSPDS